MSALQVPEISQQPSDYPWLQGDAVVPEAVYLKEVLSYQDWFEQFLMKNQLCIISPNATRHWKSRQYWVTDNSEPNFTYLTSHYGEATAPVANCGGEEFCAHPKSEMKVKDFLHYWQELKLFDHKNGRNCLYLKDWHFQRDFPDCNVYTPPDILCSDWMNEFWDSCGQEVGGDDYRFVYMGPKGSWTPLHSDVLRSYSWSANICGRKKWIFYPPGKEEKLKDKFGSLAFDVTDPKLQDRTLFPKADRAEDDAIIIIQNPGEVIFVPSGWHHQVINLEDTISINHNWMNGCSAHLTWAYVKSRLAEVQKEIADCKDMEGWDEQCQLILKADSGISYAEFYKFMSTIAQHRISALNLLFKWHHCQQQHRKESFTSSSNDTYPKNTCMTDNVAENLCNVTIHIESQHNNGDEGATGEQEETSVIDKTENLKENVHCCSCPNRFQVLCLYKQELFSPCRCPKTSASEKKKDQQTDLSKSPCDAYYSCLNLNGQTGSSTVLTDSLSNSDSVPSLSGCSLEMNRKETLQSHTKVSSPHQNVVYQNSSAAYDDDITLSRTKNACGEEGQDCLCAMSEIDTLHKSCPHWAHCGPNLARFDLERVKVIVEDMLQETSFEMMCKGCSVGPRELIMDIEKTLNNFESCLYLSVIK